MGMEPEQFTNERVDKLRTEHDGKLSKLMDKIDEKVSNKLFYTAIAILMAIFGYGGNQIGKLTDKQQSLSEELIRLEVRFDNVNSIRKP